MKSTERNRAVGANDFGGGNVIFPIVAFGNGVPLRFCSVERNARQLGAIIERPLANARHAVRYRYARQAGATRERIFANARHAVRYRYARQSGATSERIGANA